MADNPLSRRKHSIHTISLAPMVNKSDRHWRWIMRRITRYSLLYTEMITAPAVVRGDRDLLLGFDPSEKPLVLQLGWDQPDLLAEACRIAQDYGYDEINLNCGCPSEKVQQHCFGAFMMADPNKTARLVDAMSKATSLPITVKHRIGIVSKKLNIRQDSYADLKCFVEAVAQTGCRKFIVHARVALLDGLSPKENRNIPPLRYHDVYRLKKEYPDLFIEINGGYKNPHSIVDALNHTDAVMLGRVALDNPWMLANADKEFFREKSVSTQCVSPTRREIVQEVVPYILENVQNGLPRAKVIVPIMNLFAGRPGSRKWKQSLNGLISAGDLQSGLQSALATLNSEVLDEKP